MSGVFVLLFLAIFCFLTLIGIKKMGKMRKWNPDLPSAGFMESAGQLYFKGKPLMQVTPQLAAKYGQNYNMNLFGVWFTVINNAEQVKQVMQDSHTFEKIPEQGRPWTLTKFTGQNVVNTNGDVWKRHRKILNPAFKIDQLQEFVPVFAQSTIVVLEQILKESTVADVNVVMQKLTLDILGRAVFSVDLHTLENENSNSTEATDLYNEIMKKLFHPFNFLAGTVGLDRLSVNLIQKMDKFDEMLEKIIESRREARKAESYQKIGDLLDLMMDSVDDGEGLSNKELRDNMVAFYVAGHDTTSTSLTVAIHALSQFPEYQQKIRTQCREIMGERWDNREIPTFAEQKQFEQINNVIKEGLRMIPPVQLIMRYPTIDCELPNELKIQKDHPIIIDISGIHRNPTYWVDPDTFRPERFEDKNAIVPYSWMPFGGGTRACIGQQFSLIEQRIFICMLLMNYEIEPVSAKSLDEVQFSFSPLTSIKDLKVQFIPI